MSELLNYSEFSTLTQCERRWAYAYGLGEVEPGEKRGLNLGTLCHQWFANWLQGKGAVLSDTWTDDIEPGGKPGDLQTYRLTDFDPELVTRATWLAGRFVASYGPCPPSSWTVIGAERWMTRPFDGFTLVGRCDGLVLIDGQLWLIELKSYGSRPGPLAYAQVSPQLGCYSLLVEHAYGQRPFGVIYQGIYTYQWKPTVPTQKQLIEDAIAAGTQVDGRSVEFLKGDDKRAWAKAQQERHPGIERPAEESFDRIEVELGEHHLYAAHQYLASAVKRRATLKSDPDFILWQAMPNIGNGCKSCGFQEQCWFELGGVEPFEIEVEDEDDGDVVPR